MFTEASPLVLVNSAVLLFLRDSPACTVSRAFWNAKVPLSSDYSLPTIISWATDSSTLWYTTDPTRTSLEYFKLKISPSELLTTFPTYLNRLLFCVPIQETKTIPPPPTATAEIWGFCGPTHTTTITTALVSNYLCPSPVWNKFNSSTKCWQTKYDLKSCTCFWRKRAWHSSRHFEPRGQESTLRMEAERQDPGILKTPPNYHISPGAHRWNFM